MAQSARATAPSTPFHADPADELPLGVQLAWRLRALIAAGRLHPGERLPSVRTLATWAEVNVNTVRSVYARLEEAGLIATSQGRGTFVADSAAGNPDVERIAAEALAAAEDADADPREVAIVMLISASLPEALADGLPDEEEVATSEEIDLDALAAELELPDLDRDLDEGAARRELRRQVARLEAELAAYRRDLEPPGAPRLRQPEPRIAGLPELERTRDAMLAQLAAARASAARRARRERRAREVRDAMVTDPAEHRWDVVTAAEAGEEGCREWQVGPRFGPLGALMNWWRVRVSGGCP